MFAKPIIELALQIKVCHFWQLEKMYTSFLATIKFAGKRILNLISPSVFRNEYFLAGGKGEFRLKTLVFS